MELSLTSPLSLPAGPGDVFAKDFDRGRGSEWTAGPHTAVGCLRRALAVDLGSGRFLSDGPGSCLSLRRE